MPGDSDLLAVEMDVLWSRDCRGRLLADTRHGHPAPHLVLAVTRHSLQVAVGARLPGRLATTLTRLAGNARPPLVPSVAPRGLESALALLRQEAGPVEVAAGTSYFVPGAPQFDAPATILRSGLTNVAGLRSRAPVAAGWTAAEWDALLAGELGPWAMAERDGQVLSICHSARLTSPGAEAGVWTNPGARGQGLASAVTAAWAGLFEPPRPFLFYSTSAGNHSSQRVASRLGLRQIGWLWQICPGPA
ncbi:MAG: GNAT family N-acetyltransferase [Dehalococcoidia bacterium]|nr:GNAT family N-acetyltransferase [Dehalococcoidia bacterium]